MFTRKLPISAALLALSALVGVCAYAADPPGTAPIVAHTYQSVVPLGSDAVLLRPTKQLIFLVASAGSMDFQGLQRLGTKTHAPLQTSSGEPLRSYPPYVDFVVRASLVRRLYLDFHPYQVETNLAPGAFLEKFNFQVRIYRGLKVRTVAPAAITLLDADEKSRTYRVSFALRDVPVEDRIVLEILGPKGDRLTKFYMGL